MAANDLMLSDIRYRQSREIGGTVYGRKPIWRTHDGVQKMADNHKEVLLILKYLANKAL
jgi:hypothetical protein